MSLTCRSSTFRFLEGALFRSFIFASLLSTSAHAAEEAHAERVKTADTKSSDLLTLADEQRRRLDEAKKLYERGQITEAIAMWEAVYRELHPSRAFRIAYNIGVAYRQLKDMTQAAERFESFLAEFEVSKLRHELSTEEVTALEPLADRTKAELAELRRSRGRIQVNAAAVAVVAKVGGMPPRVSGFTAWVSPGTYTVIFGEGTSSEEKKTVTVNAGELVELTPTPPKPTIVTQKIETRVVTKRPYSPVYIYVASTLTAAAVGVTIGGNVWYRALEKEGANRTDTSKDQEILARASTARALGNVGLGVTIGLSALTTALITYYFVGSKEVRETKKPVPFVAPTQGGAMTGVTVSF